MVRVVAPVAGAATYLAWVGAEFGDFWKPISLQNQATLRGGFQDPVTRTVDAVGDLFGGDRFGSGLHIVWAVGVRAAARRADPPLPGVVLALRRGHPAARAVGPATSTRFERYCWSTFPFVLALAVVTDRDEVERGAYVLAAAGLVGYATLAFLGIQGP